MSREIRFNPESLNRCADRIQSVGDAASGLARALSGLGGKDTTMGYRPNVSTPIMSGLCGAHISSGSISSLLTGYAAAFRLYGECAQSLSRKLKDASDTFDRTERQLAGQAGGEGGTSIPGGNSVPGDLISGSSVSPDILGRFVTLVGPGGIISGILPWFDERKKQLVDDIAISGSFSADGTFYSYRDENISADALYYTTDASGKAGLFRYNEKGNPIFSPYAHAAIGATFGLFSANTYYQAGDDRFGAHVDTHVEVMTGALQSKAGVGLFDENGNLNPSAHARADVELTVASVSAEAGVTVLGVEGAVKGEVSIGIGAHADIGYKDGVLKADIGAAIGIGGSVSLELDVGKAVDNAVGAVKGFAKSLFPW